MSAPGRDAAGRSGGRETDCEDVVDRLYAFLDHELSTADDIDVGRIQRHLDECAPCLRERDVEVVVREVVRRACASDSAPDTLRVRILTQITQVRS
ncbi:mycothiol system anti-sigma-R factor [uncultured Pseudokineococcus sp.]|uniref:mycothiol system anti-sigma-R factor n=1 Tax=uncultured Pseudokineococcus sp. TaxID=1642928 RepID=UPI00262295ED|nr:mycothiol system anti-sigma-R factor [uncultured Pseudokineococcus sp.]